MGRKELFFIFLLFVVGGTIIFAFGVKVGEYLFESECQSIVDQSIRESRTEETAKKPVQEKEDVEVIEDTKVTPAIDTDEMQGKRIEALSVASPYALGIKKITSDIKGKYTIQISSYQDEREAQQEAYKLYLAGFKLAYYMEADIPDRGTWYRVGIGFFTRLSSAKVFAEMLRKQNKIQAYIIRKVD